MPDLARRDDRAVRVEQPRTDPAAGQGRRTAGTWMTSGGPMSIRRQVLGDVPEVLDGPRRVVVEHRIDRRPPAGTGTRRPDGTSGRSDTLYTSSPASGRRPPGRPTAPAATSSPHRRRRGGTGRPKTTVSRAVHARPSRNPARNWRQSMSVPSRAIPSAPATTKARRPVGPVDRPAEVSRRRPVRAECDPDREQAQPDRHHVGQIPGRALLRGVPEDRPEAEEEGDSQAHG